MYSIRIYTGRTDAKAEAPVLRPPDVKSWLTGKDPDAGKDGWQEEKRVTEDEMVRWHHRLDGHEFEQTLWDSEGQGSLVCCSPWGCKELDTAEWLSNNSTYIRVSDQIRSVAQSCLTLCDPMNRSTPGHPVHHQLPEFTETHVHRVSNAIQPPHPLSSPSPLAPSPSQHQSLFQWVNSSHEVAKYIVRYLETLILKTDGKYMTCQKQMCQKRQKEQEAGCGNNYIGKLLSQTSLLQCPLFFSPWKPGGEQSIASWKKENTVTIRIFNQ